MLSIISSDCEDWKRTKLLIVNLFLFLLVGDLQVKVPYWVHKSCPNSLPMVHSTPSWFVARPVPEYLRVMKSSDNLTYSEILHNLFWASFNVLVGVYIAISIFSVTIMIVLPVTHPP